MGFSYIHKNVEECLSKCCIISFETVVENYQNKPYHQLLEVLLGYCLGLHNLESLQCLSVKEEKETVKAILPNMPAIPTMHFFQLLIYSL